MDWHRPLFLCLLLGAGATATVCTGCIAFPTDFHSHDSRENIEDVGLDSITVGETSKEEMFLRLGEPDAVLDEGRVYEYHWKKIKGMLIAGGMYTAAVGLSNPDSTVVLVASSLVASNAVMAITTLPVGIVIDAPAPVAKSDPS